MDIKINYSGMTRRILAFMADCILPIIVVLVLAVVFLLFISVVGSFSNSLAHIMGTIYSC